MSEHEHEDETRLTEIEASLGSLAPSPRRLDRDRLMYLAGRASVRRSPASRLAWPSIAAAFALVALGEAAVLVGRPEGDPRIVERVVTIRETVPDEVLPPEPSPTPPGPPPEVVILHRSTRNASAVASRPIPDASDTSPAAVRLRVLRLGIEGLPEPPPLPVAMRPPNESPTPTGRSFRADLDRLLELGESS